MTEWIKRFLNTSNKALKKSMVFEFDNHFNNFLKPVTTECDFLTAVFVIPKNILTLWMWYLWIQNV